MSGSSGSSAEIDSAILMLQVPQALQPLHAGGNLLSEGLLSGIEFHGLPCCANRIEPGKANTQPTYHNQREGY